MTPTALRAIIKQFGGVKKFAEAVPVAERTVWYWLAGRKMHPVFEARVRAITTENHLQKGTPHV